MAGALRSRRTVVIRNRYRTCIGNSLTDQAGAQRLTTSSNEQLPGSWHPSGRFLAFEEVHADTMRDVMILPMKGDDVRMEARHADDVRPRPDGLGAAIFARWPVAGVRVDDVGPAGGLCPAVSRAWSGCPGVVRRRRAADMVCDKTRNRLRPRGAVNDRPVHGRGRTS